MSLSVRSPIASWVTFGGLIFLLLAPFTTPRRWINKDYALLACLVAAAVLNGLILSATVAQTPARGVELDFFLFDFGSLLGLLIMTAAASWCITRLGPSRFLVLWSAGYAPVALLSNPVAASNPWKYALALPLSAIVLVLTRQSLLRLVLLGVTLTVISGIAAYRSWILIILLTILVYIVAQRATSIGVRVLALPTVGVVVSALLLNLAQDGALGTAVADRTNTQLAWGQGNIVLGGRAEWGAALGLFESNPAGYGIGTLPSYVDWSTAIRSLNVPRGLQTTSTVSTYFEGGRIEFHSTLWNFWSHYGFAGLILTAAVAFYIIAALVAPSRGVPFRGTGLAIGLFLIATLWNLLFSPTVIVSLAPAIALAFHLRRSRCTTRRSRGRKVHEPSDSGTELGLQSEAP